MQRVYNILKSFLGESKQGGYSKDCTQYQFNCCFCADEKGGVDNKYNLEISFSLGKYHCWSCNNAGSISRLIKLRGGKALFDEYKSIINDIKESKFYDLELFKDNIDIFTEKQTLRLPSSFEKINLKTCKDNLLVKYLEKRKITQDIIDKYNIGRTTWDEPDWTWRNRIIFPSYNSVGDLNYFIGRTYRPTDKRNKYKNCDADKNNVILHEDKLNPDGITILVEGAIDCIYYQGTLSMMGKYLSKKNKIYKYLVEKSHGPIYICLDSDTTIGDTKKIYKTLNDNLKLNGRVYYIRMGEGLLGHYVKSEKKDDVVYKEKADLTVTDGNNAQHIYCNGECYDYDGYKDFGELYEAEGKAGIIKAIKTARQFEEIDFAIHNS